MEGKIISEFPLGFGDQKPGLPNCATCIVRTPPTEGLTAAPRQYNLWPQKQVQVLTQDSEPHGRTQKSRDKTPKAQEHSVKNTRARRSEGTSKPRGHGLIGPKHSGAGITEHGLSNYPVSYIFTKKQKTLKHEQKIFKDYTKQERSKFEKEMTRTSRNEKHHH